MHWFIHYCCWARTVLSGTVSPTEKHSLLGDTVPGQARADPWKIQTYTPVRKLTSFLIGIYKIYYDFFTKTNPYNLIWRISKCVNWDQLTMIRFLIWVPKLTFLNFVSFWCNVYLKNDIFKTCFRQSAKSAMTAWHVR